MITNGKGSVFISEIISADQRSVQVKILKEHSHPRPDYELHMAVAPTKNIDRFEWFLEKATEIGINEITPIVCDHSERKIIKTERLERVLQSAMKQSLQTFLPRLNPLITYEEFLSTVQGELKFIAHCLPEEKLELKRKVQADKSVVILIGPEGDFSKNEIKKALDHGFLPVSLGKNRLRTETAGIVACAAVASINN